METGKCVNISIAHTSGNIPFILSAWETAGGEMRYWTGYLEGGDKTAARTERFLRDLGWKGKITGKSITEAEQEELKKFLAEHKPSMEFPVAQRNTFSLHSDAVRELVDPNNGRLPVWMHVGSAVAELTEEGKRHAEKKVQATKAPAAAQAYAEASRTKADPEVNRAASGGVEEDYLRPEEKTMFKRVTPKREAMRVGEPVGGPTANGQPERATQAAATEDAPKATAPSPATEKKTAPTKGQPTSGPPLGGGGARSEMQQLRATLAKKEADLITVLDGQQVLLGQLTALNRELAEANATKLKSGTRFAETVLSLWGGALALPDDKKTTELYATARRAITANDALKFVISLRELAEHAAQHNEIQADNQNDFDYDE